MDPFFVVSEEGSPALGGFSFGDTPFNVAQKHESKEVVEMLRIVSSCRLRVCDFFSFFIVFVY